MIITIGRECGSGGHAIGKLLAQKLGIAFYDKAALSEKAAGLPIYEEVSGFLAENPVDSLLYTIAMESTKGSVGKIPFAFLQQLGEKDSFVLMGRGGNVAFRDHPDMLSFFICAPTAFRINRLMETEGLDQRAARKKVAEVDETRKRFHEYYTHETWGKARHHHLGIDSSMLGIEGTADFLLSFIRTIDL